MTLSRRAFYSLFAIIITEGYVVLSTELLAIRVTIPFIGSGTDTVSIIIAAVLLPLSFGYYFGGQFKPYTNWRGREIGVREKLATNIVISTAFLVIGLSFASLSAGMDWLIQSGMTNRLILSTLYSTLFLITPVFLLGQTIPLVSNYFSKEKLAKITGKILFFSTIGSFLGATFSTLVLMATVGVHYTAALNFILLAVLFFTLGRRKPVVVKAAMVCFVLIGLALNSGEAMRRMNIVRDNQYNFIKVFDVPGTDARIMSLNNNADSRYSPTDKTKHAYIDYIENHIIYTRPQDRPMNILIIGAGGFTIGLDDDLDTYHYVDIDPTLKDVAENDFLKQKLGPNKIFHPVSAEAFLTQGADKYDLILLDAYQGDLTIPENLITQEFYMKVKKRLNPGGIVASNFVVNPAFGNAFARNLDNTFRSVFPTVTRQIIGTSDYDAWDPDALDNVLYIYTNTPGEEHMKIYTDNLNTSYYDRPKSHGH